MTKQHRSILTSVGILLTALGITYAPLPGVQRTLVVVAGTEFQEPLQTLESKFEQENPGIRLELKFQGSQDIANNYIDGKNDFKPTILIPANGEILTDLSRRWQAQNQSDPFFEPPRPIVKTLLVAVAWPDRGKVLFPEGKFRWERLERVMQSGNWSAIGGPPDWGSFDLMITDPTRSSSGQLALSLFTQATLKSNQVSVTSLNSPQVATLFGLVKRSVYQPPRSTDILLQEFIARGPNDADVALIYESIALYRWQQSRTNQGKPYQIYYLDPTIETTATAAIARQEVDSDTAKAAQRFLDFLTQSSQQAVFIQYGFRPAIAQTNFQIQPNSPWSQNIPGAEVNPQGQVLPPPTPQVLTEIIRLWDRAN